MTPSMLPVEVVGLVRDMLLGRRDAASIALPRYQIVRTLFLSDDGRIIPRADAARHDYEIGGVLLLFGDGSEWKVTVKSATG